MFRCFSNFAARRNHSAGSKEGFVVVSDLERFQKIKDKKLKELRVGGPVVGFRVEETDKCWREETQSICFIVVGLDLVKVQILIPILPL